MKLLDLMKYAYALRAYRQARRASTGKYPLKIKFGIVRDVLRKRLIKGWRLGNGGFVKLQDGTYFFIPKQIELHGYTMLSRGNADDYFGDLIKKHCYPGSIAVDIGANIGAVTLPMAQAVGRDGFIAAFEPIPFLAESIRKTLAINGIKWGIIVEAAVSSSEGRSGFDIHYDPNILLDSGGSRISISDDTPQSVKLLTLDGWAQENFPHDKTLSFLKIDVEGHELEVLVGSLRTISQHKPTLLI